MKRAKMKAKSKRFMADKAFRELVLSLKQALSHARGEKGDHKVTTIIAPNTTAKVD